MLKLVRPMYIGLGIWGLIGMASAVWGLFVLLITIVLLIPFFLTTKRQSAREQAIRDVQRRESQKIYECNKAMIRDLQKRFEKEKNELSPD